MKSSICNTLALAAAMAAGMSLHAQTDSTAAPSPSGPVIENPAPVPAPSWAPASKPNAEVEAILHSPKRAAIMSACLPGLGQVYNKKYWKVPIVYAGFGVAGYYLNDNLRNIRRYKDGLRAELDGDPATINTTGFNTAQLELLIDQFTQWRDLSYIALGAIYILNIVDATVDAHLFYFDVSDDLSMRIRPYWSPFTPAMPGITLSVKL